MLQIFGKMFDAGCRLSVFGYSSLNLSEGRRPVDIVIDIFFIQPQELPESQTRFLQESPLFVRVPPEESLANEF